MIAVPFQKIAVADIQTLVDDSVREGKTVEYKEQLPTNRDDDKKEFLADVSSFANASGGDLLFGVAEARDANGKPTGIPESAPGLARINADQEIRRLESMIRDGIEPRIPGVQIRAIDGFNDGPVILLRIPKSWASPHMVVFKASPRFFSRTSAGKSPLDVAEIRAAFVQSEALPERIRRFREDRLGNILAGETPVILAQEPLTVLHIVPVSAFHNHQQVDVLAFLDGRFHLPPMGSTGWNSRVNMDGYATFSGHDGTDDPQYNYAQLFRNAAIEAVDASLLSGHGDLKQFIPSVAFERDVLQGTMHYFKAYRDIGIDGPVIVMLSLLRVRGFYMYVDPHQFSSREVHRVDKEHLIIPEVVIEDLSAAVPATMRPVFDLVWQACGYRRSYNYDDSGEWKPRS
jgi:hypothetical protein